MKALTRRDFLKAMAIGGTGLATAGLVGCSSSSADETESATSSESTESSQNEEVTPDVEIWVSNEGYLAVEKDSETYNFYKDLIGVGLVMVTQIQSLINGVYLAEIKQKDAQILALRTQINPHMLYNTLESIRMNVLLSGNAEAAQMIKLLAKMFRACLKNEDESHRIKDEVEYVNNYIELQNIRCQGQFNLQYESVEDYWEMPTISMIFQPIVENCIQHGVRGRNIKLNIKISFSRQDQKICILFSDDGMGMAKDRLEQMNRELISIGRKPSDMKPEDTDTADKSPDEENSIGLKNIAERLYLKYGAEYGLQIVKSDENGTTVKMILPFKNG